MNRIRLPGSLRRAIATRLAWLHVPGSLRGVIASGLPWLRVSGSLRGVIVSGLPWLGVVGLAYTGLGAMLAVAVVVSAGLLAPIRPDFQQAIEPARQAVSGLVFPASPLVLPVASDVLARRLAASSSRLSAAQLGVAPTASQAFGPPVAVTGGVPGDMEGVAQVDGVASGDALADGQPASQDAPPASRDAPPASRARLPVAVARLILPAAPAAPATDAADAAVDDETPLLSIGVISDPQAAVAVADTQPMLQAASEQPPTALRPVPTPTDTPLEARERRDAANQVAIDAAKAASVKARADADVANAAAIAARKNRVAPAGATTQLSVSTPAASTQAATPSSAAQPAAVVSAVGPPGTPIKASATPLATRSAPTIQPTAATAAAK